MAPECNLKLERKKFNNNIIIVFKDNINNILLTKLEHGQPRLHEN
jgi:hypothetical protein